MAFKFRLCFHLLPNNRLDSAESQILLPHAANHLHLGAWKSGDPIGNYARVLLVGGPYQSSNDANADGERARRALLLWAVQQRLAVDFGDGHHRTFLTPHGESYFTKLLGGPVRRTLHGLDVFEEQAGLCFINLESQAALKIDVLKAAESIAHWYTSDPQISEKQALAAELFCSAHFDSPFRSRFLTLMTAIEALLDHQPRPGPVVSVVQSLEAAVRSSKLDGPAKQSLISSLGWLHKESIGQAGRRTADALLPGQKYGGKDAGKYFKDTYELRSAIVHTGHVPQTIDLLDVTNDLHRFVGDLLNASLGLPSP